MILEDLIPCPNGSCLACTELSVVVFRATVLSIVLTFGGGPSVSLFCEAWCDPDVAAERGCHHEDHGSSTSVANDDSCQDTIQETVVLKNDVRRRAFSERAGCVALVTHFQLASAATSGRHIGELGRTLADLKRPQTTPLRI